MSEGIVKDYEADLDLFLSLEAKSRMGENLKELDYETAMYTGAKIAYNLICSQILFRLEELRPDLYPYLTIGERERYIDIRINQLIKEKTDEAKNKLHKD